MFSFTKYLVDGFGKYFIDSFMKIRVYWCVIERFHLELIMNCNAMGKETRQEQKIIIWKCPQRHRHTRSLKYCREELLFLRISWTIVVFYQGSLVMKAIKSEMRKIRGSQPKYCRAVSLSIWQRATQSKQTLFLQFSDSEFQH